MGNSSTKSAACKEALLALDSQQIDALDKNFRRVAGMRDPKDRIDQDSLARELHLGGDLDARLYRALHKLSGSDKPPDKGLKFDHFAVALTKCCASSRFDKRQFWMAVLAEPNGSVSKAELHVFFKILIGMTLKASSGSNSATVDCLAKESVVQAFDQVSGEAMTEGQTSAWLQREPATEDFFSKLLTAHFLVDVSDFCGITNSPTPLSTVPTAPRQPSVGAFRQGQSFARLMGKIVFKGPTVLVIKDKGGASFGAFCPVSWHKDNKFFGDSSTFVFTLEPKLRVHRSSGVNQNFMFLSTSLTSSANGLGVGGQKDYWGFHLDTLLERGVCRSPCSTFEDMPCISSGVTFEIEEVEAWGCVPDYVADEKELEKAGVKRKKPKTLEEYEARGKNSALDNNLEAKAILEAAGRTNHSDDVRAADAAMEKDNVAQRIAAGGTEPQSDDDDDDEYEFDDL